MRKTLLARLTVAVFAFAITAGTVGFAAVPRAHAAAPRPRPVTITAVSSCQNYHWVVTATIKSTTARVVDVYETNDQYTNNQVASSVSLPANTPVEVTINVAASAQKEQIGVFPQWSGGWDIADPLASITMFDPIQTNPYALC